MAGTSPAMTPNNLSIFLIAGEESGDRLGASLMAAIEELAPCPVTFAGIGGSAMAERGLHSLFPLDELAVNGFSAIPARLPLILRRIRGAAHSDRRLCVAHRLGLAARPRRRHAALRGSRAGAAAVRAGSAPSAWRAALHVRRSSACGGPDDAAAVTAGSRTPHGRTAPAAGAARQPRRRDRAPPCGVRGRGRPCRQAPRLDRGGAADRAALVGARPP